VIEDDDLRPGRALIYGEYVTVAHLLSFMLSGKPLNLTEKLKVRIALATPDKAVEHVMRQLRQC
jgi:hypothetical protein